MPPKNKSEDEKMQARKKDAERKRASRALQGTKKRSEMTNDELAHIRELDRKSKKIRRNNLTSQEKDVIRIKDRNAKQIKRNSLTLAQKEKNKIKLLIQVRKHRLLQSERNKSIARYKAKEGMRVIRKEGPMREFTERRKKHVWAIKWRKFLSCNPIIRDLEEKKKKFLNKSSK